MTKNQVAEFAKTWWPAWLFYAAIGTALLSGGWKLYAEERVALQITEAVETVEKELSEGVEKNKEEIESVKKALKAVEKQQKIANNFLKLLNPELYKQAEELER